MHYRPNRRSTGKNQGIKMKKKDIILIAAVLAISLISLAAIKMTQKDGKEVIVTVDGKEVYKTSIKKDQIYQIPEENGTNVMQIKDGKVTMIEATCPDHYCMKQKAVDEHGGSIICLPNKVVIEGENTAEDSDSDSSPKIDAVT